MTHKKIIRAVVEGMGFSIVEPGYEEQLDHTPFGLMCQHPARNGRAGNYTIFNPCGNDQHLMLVIRHYGICIAHRSPGVLKKNPKAPRFIAQDYCYEFLFERDDLAEAVLLCAERITRSPNHTHLIIKHVPLEERCYEGTTVKLGPDGGK